jgi:hypothetical protein
MTVKNVLLWSAILSVLALVAHAVDAPDHLREWWGYGTVFIILAAFQFFYGLALFIQPWKYDEEGNLRLRGEFYGRPYYFLGVILAGFSIVFYIISRTTGLPFLSSEATAEPVTWLSLIALFVNLPLLGLLIIMIRHTSREAEKTSSLNL